MILDPFKWKRVKDFESLVTAKSLSLSPQSRKAVQKGYDIVQKAAASREAVYGLNTGFGRLAQIRISPDELKVLQVNIVRSHAAALGEALAPRSVRRLLLLRILQLSKGVSGISKALLERHLFYVNQGLIPEIPQLGSVGASGDLAPLAHLALTFIGEGYFREKGRRVEAKIILKRHKLSPLSLQPKEGLALVNGTQFSLALALEALLRLKALWPIMENITALSFEAHRATKASFHPNLMKLKANAQQKDLAARLWKKLSRSPHMHKHENCDIVQDSYSFRCTAQVLGPSLSLFQWAEKILEDEINSVSDNPIVDLKEGCLRSGGHFHGQAISLACDALGMVTATLGNFIERRIDQMVNPLTSRASPFLASRAGVESGLMIVHTAAASLASENKTLAHPASADSIPTNGNQEDHVSMAPWAARKAQRMIFNLEYLVASELITAVRASFIEKERLGVAFSPDVEIFLGGWLKKFPALKQRGDLPFGAMIEEARELMVAAGQDSVSMVSHARL